MESISDKISRLKSYHNSNYFVDYNKNSSFVEIEDFPFCKTVRIGTRKSNRSIAKQREFEGEFIDYYFD